MNSIIGRFSRQNSGQNSQNELGSSKFSAKSGDSAIFLDEENFGKTPNLSRSSSVATSVCSCAGCLKGMAIPVVEFQAWGYKKSKRFVHKSVGFQRII